MNDTLLKTIFGRLTLESLPLHEPIVVATFAMVAIGGLGLVAALTYFKVWGYLWNEWFTSIDHKKIGIMYIAFALVMLLRGFADALMMRLQQAIAFNGSEGYLPPHHYDQIFTAHGVIMIFFVAMPGVNGGKGPQDTGHPEGALMKDADEKGSGNHWTAPADIKKDGANSAPGSQSNRNHTMLTPSTMPGTRPVANG